VRIVVLVKQILDPRGVTVRRDKERVFVNVEEYIIDPASKAAIEVALRLSGDKDEIVALSVGEPRADDALREALAMGCDAACLLSDPAFDQADVSVVVRILAAAIDKLGGADLVLAGRESGDTGAGQVAPRLAAALDYVPLTDVYALSTSDGRLQATRRWGEGFATVTAPLPAVLSIAPEAVRPRYPHGARIMLAYREWEIPAWDAADLGLDDQDLAPLLHVRGESFPPPQPVGEILRGEPDDLAQEVLMTLKLEKLIGQAGGSHGL
jgi:electron transfer flavoprotein beta subunit